MLLVTKTVLSSGSTLWAQGGIAAAPADTDSPQAHLDDTLVAGVGLCDPAAVRALVTEGPERVRDLVTLGAHFDTGTDGEMLLTRDGGHHADRIVNAGGDATGLEVSRALVAALDAVRGEGAHLLDGVGAAVHGGRARAGRPGTAGRREKAIVRRMAATGTDHAFLDARHLGSGSWTSTGGRRIRPPGDAGRPLPPGLPSCR